MVATLATVWENAEEFFC